MKPAPSSESDVPIAKASKKNILYWMANPKDTVSLNLDGEIRSVIDVFRGGNFRDQFEVFSETAVQMPSITRSIQNVNPAIVHFSGHGEGEKGIRIEGKNGESILFPTKGLVRLFKLRKDTIECIVLNACETEYQAEPISDLGIYVIGMNADIDSDAASDFAIGFYSSLANGSDYIEAFEIAMVHISPYLTEASTPELWKDGKIIAD